MESWTSLRTAVHAIDLEEGTWVDALFAEARGLLDEGRGLFVYSYRIGSTPTIRLGSLAGRETAPAFWQALGEWGAENQRSLARIYATGAGSLADAQCSARRLGIELTDHRAKFEAQSVADVFTIVGHDAGGFGLFLTVPRARCSSERAPKHRLAVERLSVELAAILRLREHRRRTQLARLSAAEARVARRIVEGASDKAIALELQVSLSTVSTFARRVRNKLGCRSGEEALVLSSAGSLAEVTRRLELFARLTVGECDVASELLVGSSYAEIAARRGVSVRTVASQCAAVFRKCGVSGRRALAAKLLGGTSGK
jgi:DNA-binding CsgD family transcriptional regulator